MKLKTNFRYVEGGSVWTITKSKLSIDCQLGYNDHNTTEDEAERLRFEENQDFMHKLLTFLAPHMSRSDQQHLLNALVKNIKESYVDMTYTEEYLRPVANDLVAFLNKEKEKQNETSNRD